MPIPPWASTLSQHHTFLGSSIALEPDGSGSVRGIAYSGGVIKRHPKLRNVVINIAKTKFSGTLPMFRNHDANKEVAAIELASDGKQITFSGELLDTPDATQIRANSKKRFPYSASVGISTETVRELKAGAMETINGRQIKGPAVIFEDNEITEVSLTPVAADQDASAQIFTGTNQHQPQEALTVTEQTTPTTGVTEAQLTALQTSIEAKFTAQLSASEAQVKLLSDALAAQTVKERTTQVTALFTAVGIEAKAESIAPYMGMTDAQFAAVSTDMTNLAKLKRPATNLFTATQLPGTDTPAPKDSNEILASAQQYQFSQLQVGNKVELSDAIRIVTTQAP